MSDIFERIVRDLAESDPICWGIGWESEAHCFVCESDYEIREPNGVGKNGSDLVGFIHNHDCLWVRARRALNIDNPPSRVLDEPIEATAKEKPEFSGYVTIESQKTGDNRNLLDEIIKDLEKGGYLIAALTNSKFIGMELKDEFRVVFYFWTCN